MYLKRNRVKDKKTGIIREYLRIVESYKEKGKTKKRIVAHLGRVDLIEKGKLTKLAKRLANFEGNELLTDSDIEAKRGFIFGPIILIRRIWEELNLGDIIKTICNEDISERVFVLTLNRLLEPGSEHGLSYFLEQYYVCSNKDKRWEPEFRKDLYEKFLEGNYEDRVKIEWKKLIKWYRTLDKLILAKEKIELEIYKNLRNLFLLKVDIVFYDITSIYFEGNGPKGFTRFGYSRDGKKSNKQILLGIVLADGLPIAHYLFNGDTPDKKTLEEVLKNLKTKFKLNNIILVADKGITTSSNIKILNDTNLKYILGVSLRNCEFAQKILNCKNLEWKKYDDTTKYTLIKNKEKWILVDSEKRKEYEEKMRQVWMEKGSKQLQEIKNRVKKGNLKDPQKIAYSIGSISKKYHIKRYFNWKIEKDKFDFWIDGEKLNKEMKYEGKYLLRTNDKNFKSEDLIREYKRLWEIESCFREIKDFIRIRPVYHQTEKRVRAHIFIGVIAYLVEKVLENTIRVTGMKITARDALEFSKEVKLIELEVGKNKIKLITQRTNKITEEIFNVLRIKLPTSFKGFCLKKFMKEGGDQMKLFY